MESYVDVAARNAGVHRLDLAAGHELGLFHGLAYGLNRLVDVDHHALAQTIGGTRAYPDDIYSVFGGFADNGADLCRAYVKADDEFGFWH